jgi:psiF repeat
MKKIILLLSLSLLAVPGLAATTQQEKMKACNADAAKQNLKGDARKSFMKDCLSKSKGAAAAEPKKEMTPQQARMKQCNGDAAAKNLKGDERKKFMSDCLKTKK